LQLRRILICAPVFWVALTVAGYLLRNGWTMPMLRHLRVPIEAAAYTGCLVLVLANRQFADLLRAAPIGYRVLLGSITACFMVMQVAKQDFFPVVKWHMYSFRFEPETIPFDRYVGRTGDGRELALSPGLVVPSLNRSRLLNRLEELAARADPDDPERFDAASRQLYRETLLAMAAVHNRRAPEDAIDSLEVVHCRANPKTWNDDPTFDCKTLERVVLR
jgi:hypothetical protein